MAHFAYLPAARSAFAQLTAQDRLPVLSRVAIRAAWVFAVWSQRSHTRKTLQHLTDAQLRDIGLTRDAASAEADKAFWTP